MGKGNDPSPLRYLSALSLRQAGAGQADRGRPNGISAPKGSLRDESMTRKMVGLIHY